MYKIINNKIYWFRYLRNTSSLKQSCSNVSTGINSCAVCVNKSDHLLSPQNLRSTFQYSTYSDNHNLTYGEDKSECLTEDDIQTISEGDPDTEHKLRVIILEADVMRQDGKYVPSMKFMKIHHWQEMLKLKTRSARTKYLTFLFKTEKKIENHANKKEQARLDKEAHPKMEFPDDGKIRYHLGGNHMFLRIYDTTINHLYQSKCMQAIQFGQKIIVDCGFSSNMSARENLNCAKQLTLLFSENRIHEDPYDLHYCNIDKSTSLIQALHRFIPPMYDDDFPISFHEKSYLDLFPREKLVYLTPHCHDELLEYDHDALYIIGGIVDKINNEPLTLAKAKEEGIRMAKLPLDRYLQWGSGSGKSLTLNQVTSILLDIKHTGSWDYALRHVPRRKIVHNVSKSILTARGLSYDNEVYANRKDFQRNKISDGRAAWRPTNSYNNSEKEQFSRNYSRADRDSANTAKRINIKNILND